jgi:hypothetical protein
MKVIVDELGLVDNTAGPHAGVVVAGGFLLHPEEAGDFPASSRRIRQRLIGTGRITNLSHGRPVKYTDRQRGALLGLAVGDALGAAVESKMPGTALQRRGSRPRNRNRKAACANTSD